MYSRSGLDGHGGAVDSGVSAASAGAYHSSKSVRRDNRVRLASNMISLSWVNLAMLEKKECSCVLLGRTVTYLARISSCLSQRFYREVILLVMGLLRVGHN